MDSAAQSVSCWSEPEPNVRECGGSGNAPLAGHACRSGTALRAHTPLSGGCGSEPIASSGSVASQGTRRSQAARGRLRERGSGSMRLRERAARRRLRDGSGNAARGACGSGNAGGPSRMSESVAAQGTRRSPGTHVAQGRHSGRRTVRSWGLVSSHAALGSRWTSTAYPSVHERAVTDESGCRR
jgi:hypothetical protein